MEAHGKLRKQVRALFFLYCLFMFWLLFFRSPYRGAGVPYTQQLAKNINPIPFYTIRNYLYVIFHRSNPYLIRHCIVNLAGNVLLFIPTGLLMPVVFPKLQSLPRFLLICFGGILAVECIQLFSLLGSFDVDDIILNLGGLLIGYGLYRLIRRLNRRHQRRNHV